MSNITNWIAVEAAKLDEHHEAAMRLEWQGNLRRYRRMMSRAAIHLRDAYRRKQEGLR